MQKEVIYKVGDKVSNAFVVTKAKPIKALKSVLYEFTHEKSNAKVMHIANDDQENVFCLNFMTLPTSSNGVAHILEHTVLCGSKKYPVKDPFFSMTRRSLNTFMNAMTGSDFTCYPAASQVEKDFYNLLDVYLDAAFEPLLKKLSFLQEGHRLEFLEMENPKSKLTYQGIVFNEMKGSLSSADARLWHAILEHITPDLPYRFNSGGDPKEIPDLTFEEFIKFHKTYYDPSHCIFYFYGNLPSEKHLDFIEDRILKNAKKSPPLPPISKQKRMTQPKNVVLSYPTEEKDLSNKTFVTFSWLTVDILEQQDLLALQLIDSILMDTDASPLKLALMNSKLCRSCDAYLDVEISEVPFAIVCKGTEEKHADALEKVLFDTLKKIEKEGISKELIDSSLHQLEFSRSEITGDYSPFGLTLFFRSALASMHGCPPENSLIIHELFEKLLKLTEDPRYLPSIIKKYLIDNPHFVRIVMKPDLNLAEEEKKEEELKLQEVSKNLSKDDQKRIVEEAVELKKFQETQETSEIECLPKIQVEDIPKNNTEYPLRVYNLNDGSAFYHECFTNHIVYADLVTSLPKIEEDKLPFVRLFSYIATDVGVGDNTYIEHQRRLHLYTGGLGFSSATHTLFSSPDEMKPAIHLRGKALSRNTNKLFDFMKGAYGSLRLDEKERIKELILQLYTLMQSKLNRNAMSYAVDFALTPNSKTTKLHHLWHGLPYYKFIEDLALNIDKKLPSLIEELEHFRSLLLHGNDTHLILACDEEDFTQIEKEGFYGMDAMPKSAYTPWGIDFKFEPEESHARVISSPVAFTCKATKIFHAPHDDIAPIALASNIFDHKTLHKKIREQGGAYGCGSFYNTVSGNFYMYSYRDPNITSTVEAFSRAIELVADGQFNDNDLDEAKISIIQALDSPVSPGTRAFVSYCQRRENRTPTFRQAFRESIMQTSSDDIKKAVKKHLSDFANKATLVTFAGKDLIVKENETLPSKLPIIPI